MERELLLSGVGGQGVQLAAQVLAGAATLEGREVMLFGVYGGSMRGGPSDATIVVADAPIASPPIVSHSWSAVVLQQRLPAALAARLRPGAVVLVNASLFEGEVDRAAQRVFEVPASQLAAQLGSGLAASMVMAGAYAAVTQLVSADALVAAMRDAVPAYRRQHLDTNERALRAGYEAVPRGAAPAWETEA